ncbi:hypothetical protein KJ611_04420 [Patescibacteria group bacterium]|nr:hypothetical protein [Patescibacteria group bacterium]
MLSLARKIEATGWVPNQIIGIIRGAALAANILSEYWSTPCAYLAVQTYGQDKKRLDSGDIYFNRQIINNSSGFGQQALLIDDLSDTGFTLQTSYEWLLHDWNHVFKRLRCAMVFFKKDSTFIPDFYARLVEPDQAGQFPWIKQPWEVGFHAKEDPNNFAK